jgi:hypothetical protein
MSAGENRGGKQEAAAGTQHVLNITQDR